MDLGCRIYAAAPLCSFCQEEESILPVFFVKKLVVLQNLIGAQEFAVAGFFVVGIHIPVFILVAYGGDDGQLFLEL